MANDIFSFSNLRQKLIDGGNIELIDEASEYTASYFGGEFIFVHESHMNFHVTDKIALQFHVSLLEYEEGVDEPKYKSSLGDGWNLVKDILIENQVKHFKIAHSSMAAGDGKQRGKTITIDARYNSEKSNADWFEIVQNISSGLDSNDIHPGHATVKDPAESNRYDRGLNAYLSYRFLNTRTAKTQWPSSDPFQGKEIALRKNNFNSKHCSNNDAELAASSSSSGYDIELKWTVR